MITNRSEGDGAKLEALAARPASRNAPQGPKAASKTKIRPRHVKQGQRTPSKQDRVLAMLRQKDGTTTPALMKATGWQQHSVRGFLSGVVRNKLKLKLVSTKVGDQRLYRIVDKAPAKADGRRTKRQPA